MRVVPRWVGAALATVALALVLAACLRSEPDGAAPLLETLPVASPEDGGAFSVAPVEDEAAPQPDTPPAFTTRQRTVTARSSRSMPTGEISKRV